MSRAFVKETAQSAPPPERMVSDGPNLVTKEGSAQIGTHVERLEAALKDSSASGPDVLARETLERDLRYWSVRKASAQIVPRREDDTVAFGSSVTIRRGAREQTFRIVGADEADPTQGRINFASPLADAILGARPGDIVEADTPLGEIEIVRVEN